MTLADRNTVKMVATYWGCSSETVYRRINDGTLPCLRIAGMIRITREQVEACEAQCTSFGNTPTETITSSTAPASRDAFQLGRKIAGELKRSSLSSSPEVPHLSLTVHRLGRY